MYERTDCECVPRGMSHWGDDYHGFGRANNLCDLATRKEKVELLNEYQHSLEDELDRVRVRIKALSKKQ